MPTELTKTVVRKTRLELFDRGKHRPILVYLMPAGRDNAVIGLRIAGTRSMYKLGVQTALNVAIRKHHDDIERLAKRLQKDEGLTPRRAKAEARKRMEKQLKEHQ